MEAVRSIRTVVVEISNIKGYRDWISEQKYENRVNCLQNVFIDLSNMLQQEIYLRVYLKNINVLSDIG